MAAKLRLRQVEQRGYVGLSLWDREVVMMLTGSYVIGMQASPAFFAKAAAFNYTVEVSQTLMVQR